MNTNIKLNIKSVVAEKMRKEAFDNAVANALTARDLNNYEAIKTLKANKGTVIKLNNPEAIVRVLARLGYVAGSMVGIITNLVEISGVLMDNEYNRQFLKEDGTVDLRKLRKVFQTAGTKGDGEGYEEIFTEENNKVFLVENLQGRRMRLVKALKSDIATFVKQLENTKVYTQEDLVRIGKDLEKIGRVMQELEIDSAKDATVKEGMMEITEFMSAYTCKLSSKKLTVSHNFAEIVANKKSDSKHKTEVKFSYKIDDYLPLDKAYEEAAKQFALFVSANPNASQEELSKAKQEAVRDAINDSLIEDAATELKRYMVQYQEYFLNQLVDMYELSDMKLFEEFLSLGLIDKDENDIANIKKMVIIACEMINNHFKYSKHIGMTKIDELAAKLRNAIYTLGEAKGFTPEETFKIAVNAGWFNLKQYKGEETFVLRPKNKYRYTAIAAMFTNELKWHFNADAMYSTIEVELPADQDNFRIAPNTPFYMENGECEVELLNGETDFLFCTEEDDYTGIVIAKIINDEAVFVKHCNEYEFERVEFIMFDHVCDLTQKANVYSAGADAEVIGKAVTTISETNTKDMDNAQKELAEKADAERIQQAFKLWANAIQLSVTKKDAYGLYTNKVNGKLHLNIRKEADGASRMLGRMSHAVKYSKINEYTNMDTIVCTKGAIAILNK